MVDFFQFLLTELCTLAPFFIPLHRSVKFELEFQACILYDWHRDELKIILVFCMANSSTISDSVKEMTKSAHCAKRFLEENHFIKFKKKSILYVNPSS